MRNKTHNSLIIKIPIYLGALSLPLYYLRKLILDSSIFLAVPLPGVIFRLNEVLPWLILIASLTQLRPTTSTSKLSRSASIFGIQNITLLATFVAYLALNYLNSSSHANYSYALLGAPFEHVATYVPLLFVSLILSPLNTRLQIIFRDFRRGSTHKYIKPFSDFTQQVFVILVLFQLLRIITILPRSINAKLDPNGIFVTKQVVVDELSRLSKAVIIVHPPQDSRWPALSNQVILRYYLFPRTLVSGEIDGLEDSGVLSDSFYLIQSRNTSLDETWPSSLDAWLKETLPVTHDDYQVNIYWENNSDTIYLLTRITD